jgi:hypothetical protein
MLRKHSTWPWLAALSLILSAQALAGPPQGDRAKNEEHREFIRLIRQDDVPVRLETAVIRHVPQDCGRTTPTVDLVAAMHIAEKSYYEQLNRLFETYDVVLYELVAPEGTQVPKGGPTGDQSPVTMVQTGMTGMLGLEFQLKGVDYTRKNFVHADMSPDQFAQSMQKRGESVLQTFTRLMGYAMTRQNGGSGTGEGQLLAMLFSQDRTLTLKRIMAEQFEDMEGSLTAINGPEGSTLITERNKVALGVLRKQISAGKKSLAIFYGAGHMPDFQKRLADEFGLVPISTQWLVAWDMQGKARQ